MLAVLRTPIDALSSYSEECCFCLLLIFLYLRQYAFGLQIGAHEKLFHLGTVVASFLPEIGLNPAGTTRCLLQGLLRRVGHLTRRIAVLLGLLRKL